MRRSPYLHDPDSQGGNRGSRRGWEANGIMVIGYLALTVAATLTGAGIYVSCGTQPARLGLEDCPLLAEWKRSYKRGTTMQAGLALLAFLLGTIAWWQTGKPAFLVGALVMLAPWPWTLLVIRPTNDALLAIEQKQ